MAIGPDTAVLDAPARLGLPAVAVRIITALSAATDLAAMLLAVLLSMALRWYLGDFFQREAYQDYELLVFAGAAIVAINAALGLYPGYGLSDPERFRRRLVGVTLVFILVAGWDYFLQHGLWSRVVSGLSFVFGLLLTVAFNDALRQHLQKLGLWGVPVAVHGHGRSAERMIEFLQDRAELGFVPVAVVGDELERPGGSVAGLPVVRAENAASMLPDVRHVFVHMPDLPPERWAGVINRLRFAHVYLVPSMTGQRSLWVQGTDLQGTLALSLADNLLDERKLWLKRSMDLLFGSVLLATFMPLLLVIYVLVRLSSRGPGLFVQPRVGRHGAIFRAYKFRTMVVDAERRLGVYLAEDPAAREEYATYKKLRRDPRITLVGRLLRRYSLDELPQILNVLKGEMSLVGPRCYLPHEVPEMNGDAETVQSVLPGITGYWQVSGRNRSTFAQRVAMDVYYIRNWSVSFDLFILYRTISAVLAARNAY